MQRIIALAMSTIAAIVSSCGAASDSAMPAAQAQEQVSPSSSAASSSSSSSSSSSAQTSSSASGSASSSDPPSIQAPVYQLIDLGRHDETVYIWIPEQTCPQTSHVINDTTEYDCRYWAPGQPSIAVGYVEAPDGIKPFIDTAASGPTILTLPDGTTSGAAVNFNDSEVIVGWGQNASGTVALQWEDSTTTVLPSLAPTLSAEATAINNEGEVGGYSQSTVDAAGDIDSRAVIWEPCQAGYCVFELDHHLAPGTVSVNLATVTGIDCEGDVSAYGGPGYIANASGQVRHDYLLVRIGGNGASCP